MYRHVLVAGKFAKYHPHKRLRWERREDDLNCRLWLAAVIVSSLALRLSFADFESGDYLQWLSRWYDFFVEHGAWHGLGELTDRVTNYPPLYMYMVSVSTLLPLPPLYAIKLFSVAVDYLAAWYISRLIREQGGSRSTVLLVVTIFLFLPTVVMNSAVWAQCDIMYTTGLLASLYYLLGRRPVAALMAFGVSCSLKPQAIFWCPLLAALFFNGRLPWKYVWVPGAVYVLSCLPAIFAGRPALDVLLHWNHIHYKPGLVFHAPNWYQWVEWHTPDEYQFWSRTGIVLTVIAVGVVVLVARQISVARRWGSLPLIMLALTSVLLPPFLLPKMHERYFFPADVISILYAVYVPSGWLVAVLIQLASAMAYWPFLFRHPLVPWKVLPVFIVIALGWVIKDFVRLLRGHHPAAGFHTAVVP